MSECAEGRGLILRNEQLRGSEAIQLILELGAIRILGHGELASGVIDAGETEFFPILINGSEIVGPLVVEQVEIINRARGEDA